MSLNVMGSIAATRRQGGRGQHVVLGTYYWANASACRLLLRNFDVSVVEKGLASFVSRKVVAETRKKNRSALRVTLRRKELQGRWTCLPCVFEVVIPSCRYCYYHYNNNNNYYYYYYYAEDPVDGGLLDNFRSRCAISTSIIGKTI